MHRSFKQLAIYRQSGRLMSGDAAECVRLSVAEISEELGFAEPAVRDTRVPFTAYRRK